jgi:choline monooxygenase
MPYFIQEDIHQANTMPGTFYNDAGVFNDSRDNLFARTWQMVHGAENLVRLPFDAMPFTYMEHFMEEPLLLLRDANNQPHCLSNVCTHRGKILVEQAGKLDRGIICGYHGRRFQFDGSFVSMPETQGMLNFPCAEDNLPRLPVESWRQFTFTSLQPAFPFSDWIATMEAKVGFMPIDDFQYSPERSRDYLVKAHWALYCDNYLEGFHIPFVHKALAAVLDWGAYRTECFNWGNCQVGISKGGEHVFDLPEDHPDFGQLISAYYFWLFPNIMFNFYPWGLSLNLIQPLQPNLTRVKFRTYIWDESKLNAGAGADIDLVEREDEAVVENVQVGTKSRYYKHGRFSPTREQGVHQFHRLLAQMLP